MRDRFSVTLEDLFKRIDIAMYAPGWYFGDPEPEPSKPMSEYYVSWNHPRPFVKIRRNITKEEKSRLLHGSSASDMVVCPPYLPTFTGCGSSDGTTGCSGYSGSTGRSGKFYEKFVKSKKFK